MWRQSWRSSAAVLGWVSLGAVAAPPLPSADVQRLQALERTELPQARQALQSHLQHCDTLMAVLYARQAMAMTDGMGDSSSWQDMEVLIAQCKVTANQHRSTVQALEAEQAQLQQSQGR